jgi:tetratricopeptide (TPR) repeat protein
MKKFNNMKNLVGVLLLIFLANTAWSQCKEFKWPEDKAKAEEQLAIYGDAIKQQNYRAAVPGIQWFLANAPDWNVKLYIEGADVYQKLATAEKDPAKRQSLVDSLMWFYDQRIKVCGDEVNVLNRKAIYAAVFNGGKKESTASVLEMLDRVFEISGNNVLDNNLESYMRIVQANVTLLKNLSEEQILSRYDKLTSVIDQKLKKAQEANKTADVEKLKKIKAGADDQLIKMVKVDCAFVKKNLEPKFRQTPEDLGLAKKIFGFMLADKCTDDPLWLEAGEVIHKNEKDYGLAKNLAAKYLSSGNEAKAEELFKEATTLANDPAQKSESLMNLGSVYAKKGAKGMARDYYRQAVTADPSNKEPYEKIGDLYHNSFDDCSKKENMAQDRLVYIAAYEMYAKSGNSQKMAASKAQFPSKEDIFLLNWKAGEEKSTGCWIGESVSLRTRD